MNIEDLKGLFATKKRWLLWGLAALLLLATGYGAGRYAQPAKVVEKTKTVTQVQEHVVYRDRVVEEKDQQQQAHRRRHKVVTTTKKPDGTVTTVATEDDANDSSKNTEDKKIEYRDRVVEKVVQQTITKEKLVLRGQPRWGVHAGVGVSIPHYLGAADIGVPGLQGWVVEAGADVRIVGPFWAGVWGNTQGSVGADLRLSF